MARMNLLGQKFGHLTVLRLDEERTNLGKGTYWFCKCDCGYEIPLSILGSNLKKGNSTKCKYCRAQNLIGQTFGELTVIERYIDEKDHVNWKCQCSCGNIVIVRPDSLKSGHTRSCGCLQKKAVSEVAINRNPIIGKRFGKLTVLKLDEEKTKEKQESFWLCQCDCGTIKSISRHHLISGRTLSCGCLKSKGEEKIAKILSENNIPFEKEKIIENFTFSTGGHPRIDFVVNGTFIEYQGEQHYNPRKSGYMTEDKIKIIQLRDKEKQTYCENNNIPLVIIPYWDFDKISLDYLIEKGVPINVEGEE